MEIPEQAVAKRIMVGIPVTGLVRFEWVMGRYNQTVPCNWSQVDCIEWIKTEAPYKHLVADARNIIAQRFIERDYEWLFFIDHDVVLPPGTVLRWNERMRKVDVPVWCGLYFSKSVPAEPLIYRGRGNSFYDKWKIGDEVWCDGIPMGCTMIHKSILKTVYDESEEYEPMVGIKVRKVFETPCNEWYDPEKRAWHKAVGTEDLHWCTRVMKDNIFKKAGWPKYQRKKYPFMVDTNIFCRHIDFNGMQYPSKGEEQEFIR